MDHPLLSAWSQPPSQADKLLHPHHRYSGTKSSLVPDARVSPCPLLSKRFTSADDGSLDGRSSSWLTKTPNNLLFCSEPLTPRRQPKIVSRIIISDDFSLVPLMKSTILFDVSFWNEILRLLFHGSLYLLFRN